MAEFDQKRNFETVGGRELATQGATLASGTTIAPTHRKHVVSGTSAVVNITLPYADFDGDLILIPSGVFTWTAAGNIAIAGTAVVNKALRMTYLRSTGKFVPSYIA